MNEIKQQERIEALLERARVLKDELARVEQDLYDLNVDNYLYITGMFHRKSEARWRRLAN